MVSLDDALKSFSLRHADHIDPVALLEDADGHRLSDRHLSVLLEFTQPPAGRRLVFLQVTQLRLRKLALLHLAKGKLNSLIAVPFLGLDSDHAAGTGFDHRHRRQATLIKYLSHPQFFSEQPVRPRCPSF